MQLTEQFHIPDESHEAFDRLTTLVQKHTQRLLEDEYWTDHHLHALNNHSDQSYTYIRDDDNDTFESVDEYVYSRFKRCVYHRATHVLDATRADAAGVYGGPTAATPTIDRLAENGIAFSDCIASAPWTPASHASLLTGRYPSGHGVRANNLQFPQSGHYLPETLQEIGIRTQGIGAEPWLARRQRFHRGFERFHDISKLTENLRQDGHHTPRDLPTLLRAGLGYGAELFRNQIGNDRDAARYGVFLFREWLSHADSFNFINISVAHGSYDPPQVFRDRLDVSVTSDDPYLDHQSIHPYIVGHETPSEEAWTDIRQLYAAGVSHADYLLKRAIESMDDDTWLIVTADHGDNLGEKRRAGHQFSLSDNLITSRS